VADGPKKGIIYRSGEYICRDLDSVGPLSNGFYCIEKGGLYGYIRQDGRAFVEPKYEDASDFSEGLAAVSQDKKWGYIDSSFKSVISPRFASAAEMFFSKETLNPLILVNSCEIADICFDFFALFSAACLSAAALIRSFSIFLLL
jgi:hypothetical protein